MKSAIMCAVAISLAAMPSLASAEDFRWGGPVQQSRPATQQARPNTDQTRPNTDGAILTLKESDVGRLRAALNLTPEQQPHWGPVEAALIDIARQDSRAEATGLVSRTSAVATRAVQLRRLKSLAGPLIRSLDDSQKRDAIAFARRLGYGQLVASF